MITNLLGHTAKGFKKGYDSRFVFFLQNIISTIIKKLKCYK